MKVRRELNGVQLRLIDIGCVAENMRKHVDMRPRSDWIRT